MSVQSTERREALFDFIVAYKREHDGNSPTLREMCQAVGISSTGVVNYHLRALERAGLIRLDGNRKGQGIGAARSICVMGGAWSYTPVTSEYVGRELAPGVIAHVARDIEPETLGVLSEMAAMLAEHR